MLRIRLTYDERHKKLSLSVNGHAGRRPGTLLKRDDMIHAERVCASASTLGGTLALYVKTSLPETFDEHCVFEPGKTKIEVGNVNREVYRFLEAGFRLMHEFNSDFADVKIKYRGHGLKWVDVVTAPGAPSDNG